MIVYFSALGKFSVYIDREGVIGWSVGKFESNDVSFADGICRATPPLVPGLLIRLGGVESESGFWTEC